MLRILGIVFLVLVSVGASFFGWVFYQDRQASAYVAEVVPAIYSTWNFDELSNRSGERLANNAEFQNNGPKMFELLRDALGNLKSSLTPRGKAGLGWGQQSPARGIYGEYVVMSEFERGSAELYLFIVRDDGVWKIEGFNVNSPVLAKFRN